MTQLSTLSDGETYADIRLGHTFIVSVDRTAHKDAITVRVFDPDQPDVAIGEHHLDSTLPGEGSATAPWDTTPSAHSSSDSNTDNESAPRRPAR